MSTRKDRLIEAYDYLRQNCQIHTKKDLAESIQHTLPAMYSAFGGNEAYLTDSLLKKICEAFPNTFNLSYLLTGQGQLTQTSPIPPPSPSPTVPSGFADAYPSTPSPQPYTPETTLLDLTATLIKEIETLRKELTHELTQVRQERLQLQTILQSYTTTPNHHPIHPHHTYTPEPSTTQSTPSLAAEPETPPPTTTPKN